MGRRACCVKMGLKKGTWTAAEDEILVDYIKKNGHGCWRSLPKHAGLLRCGKSCRLRWTNYLNPDIKRGPLSREEEKLVIQLHGNLGNSWAAIASQLPGRTDNEIKNLWNTHLKKRLLCMGIDPQTHSPSSISNGRNTKPPASPSTSHMAQSESARLEAEAPRSRGSLPVNPPSLGKTSSDHFLRIWNSELGESFQNFHNGNKTACQILGSQSSPSSTKCGSVSYTTLEMGAPLTGSSATGNSQNEDLKCADDSSDTAFLDFLGNVDSFLERNDNYALFPTILSESSLNCSP